MTCLDMALRMQGKMFSHLKTALILLTGRNQRRNLGKLVLEDQNEIIRIICAELLKSLVSSGFPRHHLWPIDTNDGIFNGFPDTSQGETGWHARFQSYMDGIWEARESQEPYDNKPR